MTMVLSTSWAYRNCDRFFYGPTFTNAFFKCSSSHAPLFRPFNEQFSYAIEGQKPAASAVSSLLRWRGPAAIIWFVISIVILTFQAQPFRPFPHVFKERLERIHPSLANSNTSPAISVVCVKPFLATSPKHVLPNAVFCSFRSSMRGRSLASPFADKTPATLRQATCETVTAYAFLRSTKTCTSPIVAAPSFPNVFKNGPSPKGLSGQVFCLTREYGTIISKHENTSFVRVARVAQRLRPAGLLAFYNEIFAVDTMSTAKRRK